MLFDRPSPSDLALNDYWNALNANAPGDELERLAAAIEPTELAALHRARVSKQRFSPDPLFVRRLEDTLMTISATLAAGTIPHGQIGSTGRRVDVLDRGRIARPSTGRTISWRPTQVVAFIAVAAILLGIVGGIWLASRPNDDFNVIQPAGTPIVETTPDDGSDFPMYRGNSGRTGVVNAPGPSGSPVELWTITGLPGALSWSSAIVDGVLYAGGGDEGLIAVDALTGERLWNYQTEVPVDSGPAVSNGLVFFADIDGLLHAVDLATHELRWSLAGTRPNSSVAIADNLVYAVTPEGTFYALDVETGEIAWQQELGADANGAPAVADGIALQNSAGPAAHAFDALTGEELWTFSAGESGGMATPTLANGVAYVTVSGEENRMVALDASSGEQIWVIEREPGEAFISSTASADRIFSGSEDGVVHAINAADGAEVWTYQLGASVTTVPILAGTTLFTVDNAGFVRALSAVNGSEMWSYPVEGGFRYALSVAGDVIYTGTDLGNYYAITGDGSLAIMVESGQVEAATPVATPSAVAAEDPVEVQSGTVVVDAVITGSNAGAFRQPSQTVIAPDGNLWIVDARNNRIHMFTPDGEFIESWGEAGSGDGQFDFMRNDGDSVGFILFLADGTFLVSDPGNFRVQHFSADRAYLGKFGSPGNGDGQFVSPECMAVDSEGNIWVSDTFRDVVMKFDAEFNYLLTVGGTGSDPGQLNYQWAIRVDTDDSLWVSEPDNRRVQHFASDGTLIEVYIRREIPGAPSWIGTFTFDHAGNMYFVSETDNKVFVLNSEMQLIGTWSFVLPDGRSVVNSNDVQIGDDGRIIITDYDLGLVVVAHLDPVPEAQPD